MAVKHWHFGRLVTVRRRRLIGAVVTPGAQLWRLLRHHARLLRFAHGHIGTRRLLQAIGLDAGSTAANGAVLAIAATFATVMESGQTTFSKFGIDITIQRSFVEVLLVCVPILLLLAFSSAARYWAAKSMRNFGRITQVEIASTLFEHFHWLDRANLSDIVDQSGKLNRLIVRDARHCGMAVEIMLRLMQPIGYIVLALATIFYLEPVLSLVLIPLSILVFPLIWHLSRRIQRNAKEFYEGRIKSYSRVVGQAVQEINATNVDAVRTYDSAWLKEQPDYLGFLDAFDFHRLASERMGLVVAFTRSLFVAVGVAVFGWFALEGERSWGSMVGFLGGLLFLMSGAQNFFMFSAKLIRFYPQASQAFAILDKLKSARDAAGPLSQARPMSILFRAQPNLAESRSDLTMSEGELGVLISPLPLLRHRFFALARMMSGGSNMPREIWQHASFLGSVQQLSNAGLADAVLAKNATAEKTVWLERLLLHGLGETFDDLFPEGLETALTTERWSSLPNDAQALLAFAAACADEPPVLFVAADVMRRLPAGTLLALPELSGIPFLFVAAASADLPVPGDCYIVGDGETLVGLGDLAWFEAQRETIAEWIEAQIRSTPGASGNLMDELIDDEM